ncbi:hypothetical protein G9A89_014677 [Geosiphon pyriformis]|nr:hypothetical protein G9A89_014677 [Geosiphon pyriformis]
MEPVDLSAGGSGSVLAGLEICLNAKKNHLDTVYSCNASYKKTKKTIASNMVDSFAGPLSLRDIGGVGVKSVVSWGSEIGSVTGSVNKLSDVKNMANMVAKETSYVKLGENDDMDKITLKKTCICTYVLGNLPKQLLFNCMSDNDSEQVLLSCVVLRSNKLPPLKSCVLKKQSFNSLKFFVLDIELLTVPGKTISDKLICVKKIFYYMDGFGRASTPSKFPDIIKLSFISESSLNKTKELAVSEKILVNNKIRKVNSRSDWRVIIKKIPVNLPKLAVESVFFKFGKIVLIKMQLIGLKTCFIGCNPNSYVHDKCAVVCFADEASKLAAIVGLSLACCTKCKQFGHISDVCSVGRNSSIYEKQVITNHNWVCLAGIYKKKQAPIACSVFFGGKTWAQVAGGFSFHVAPSVFFSASPSLAAGTSIFASASPSNHDLYSHLASLECSFELLANQISGILKKLGSIELVHPIVTSVVFPPVVPVSVVSSLDMNIVLNGASVISAPPSQVINDTITGLSLSNSKVLTTKVSGLKSKMMALEVLVEFILDKLDCLCSDLVWKVATYNIRDMNNPAKQDDIICWHKEQNNLITVVIETKLKSKICPWIINKFDDIWIFTFGLDSGYLDSGVVIIINVSLAKHMCKVSKVLGWLISLKLLFKNKLFVSILGLYAGASLVAQFSQAGDINFIIAKAVNKFSFVILGGDFNKDGSHKCASFKKCLDLGLVNFLSRCSYEKMPTWANSCGVAKTINFLFISSNLVNTMTGQNVFDIGEFFDTDHQAISMSVGLDGLLDTWLNSLCKQANRDCWKFNFKGADETKWKDFGNAILANALMFSDEFATADVVCKIIVLLANKVFKKRWFKGFDDVFTRESSRYYKLEFLVSKIVKALHEENVVNFDSLMKCWVFLDNVKASVIQNIVNSGAGSGHICSALCGARKTYCIFKLTESLRAKEATIKAAIDKRMKSFEVNKSHTIRSVLECPFHKMVLDHLVVDNELILKPDLVKFKVDGIMEGWTRKYCMVDDVSDDRCYQYQSLKYVFDEAFSDLMCSIKFNELFGMISSLLNGKAAGLSAVLNMLLVLLNSCLSGESVSDSWKEAWILMISKPYDWEDTAHKILSKIFFDKISLACNTFDILHGNNFLVLKGTTSQSSIFAIGLMIIRYIMVWTRERSIKSRAKLSSFFAANTFVNNTIWVGSSQSTTQQILDVAGEFFWINDVSINNDKTVIIPINSRVSNPSLSINGLLISIAKKGESHQYLVLWKAVSDKQLLYLVLAVLHSIVSYITQFSFVSVGVCNKWDVLICKGLKLKSSLPLNFPSDIIHNPSFYSLKPFFQVQSESKVASLVSFVNSNGIVDHLFSHRSHDLQVLCWNPVHLLSSFVRICVSASNNFLAGIIHVFLDCNLSLSGSLATPFRFHGGVPMSAVLDKSKFLRFLPSLRWHDIAFVNQLCDHYGAIFNWYTFKCWKRLNPHGSIPEWFKLSVVFLNNAGTSSLSVYTDGFFSNLDIASCKAGAAAYFEDIGLGLRVNVSSLMSSILAEFSIHLFSDSQSALDVCKLELKLAYSDFHNQCWVKHHHIVNVIHGKNLRISWHKVKSHSDISGNECIDYFPPCLNKHFLIADGSIVSGNSRHFVHDIYYSVCCARWEVGSGSKFLAGSLLSKVDWCCSLLVWHSDLNMATSFTSKLSANACTYFMKALYHQLLVAVRKHFYIRLYPSVLCLYCGQVEVSDHVFSCKIDEFAQHYLLESHLLSSCISDFFVFMAFYKGFVFDSWFCKAVSVFHDSKVASLEIVKFVHSLGLVFRTGVWSIHAKYYAYMEKNELIPIDGSAVISVPGSALRFSAGIIKLLGIADAVGICFGFCKSCLFFFGIGDPVSVHIAV